MLRSVRAKTQSVILVCGKCPKKIAGGFGKKGGASLAKALRKRADGKKGRKADLLVAETACLTLCPKGAVVAMNAARPDAWVIVPAHTDVDQVAEAMGVQGLSKG